MQFLLQDGDGFFICEDQEEFLRSKILENFNFKTNSYGSFIRQLNNCKYSLCNFCFPSFQNKLSHGLSRWPRWWHLQYRPWTLQHYTRV